MEFEIDIKPKIKRLEIFTKRIVQTNFIGGYRSAFKGKGMEFEGYREYTTNDDARLIDWKTSLKLKKLVVKELVEERNLNVFFLIDVSSSMVFGSTEKLKNEYAAELAASMCYAILMAGDTISFALFTDRIVDKTKPDIGMKQFFIFSRALVNPRSYGGRFDLGNALRFLSSFVMRDSLVILISDLIGFKEGYERDLKIAGRRFDMISIMVRDPRDRTLPKGSHQILVSDPYSGEQLLIDPNLIREKYEKYVKEEEDRIRRTFLESNIDFLELSTDQPFIVPVMNFFLKRHRKWR
jgi:uncharacterized protein (DUF58 family)